LTQLETLDVSAELCADFIKNYAENLFPADFVKALGSQVIPSWVIVS